MKILLISVFLFIFNSVQADPTLYACIHWVQDSNGGTISRDPYTYVTENMACPNPHGYMNQVSSDLNKDYSSHNANKNPDQLNDPKPVQAINKIDRNMQYQKGYNLIKVHLVTEPECIWYKQGQGVINVGGGL